MAERKSKETLAVEALDLAVRVLEKAKARAAKTKTDAENAVLALQDAERKHVFAAESPYLPQNQGDGDDEAVRAEKAAALAAQVAGDDTGGELL